MGTEENKSVYDIIFKEIKKGNAELIVFKESISLSFAELDKKNSTEHATITADIKYMNEKICGNGEEGLYDKQRSNENAIKELNTKADKLEGAMGFTKWAAVIISVLISASGLTFTIIWTVSHGAK